jgi:parallel beta-helix repeat protein
MTTSELLALLFVLLLAGMLALPLLLWRFGSVNRPWIVVSKAERAELKRLSDLYAATHPKAKPRGRPLYRKGMWGRNGLAVYENGLRATFQLGPKGKYRFVPFEELSGLYPAKFQNLAALQMTLVGGELGKTQLQVETESGRTYVTTDRHPLAVVVPLLQRGLGPRWEALFHPGEAVDLGIGSGQGHIHKVVRASRPPPFVAGAGVPISVVPAAAPEGRLSETAGEGPAASAAVTYGAAPRVVAPAPAAALDAKGPLVIEETPASVEHRARQLWLGGVALVAAGAAVAVVGFLVSGWLGGRSLFFTFLWLVIGPLLAAVGVLAARGSRARYPMRFYENGFEARNPITGRVYFFSWGEIQFAILRQGARGQSVYMIRVAGAGTPISLPADIPGLPALMEAVKPRIANPAFKVKLPGDPEEGRKARGAELVMYAAATGLGAVMGWMVGAAASLGLSPSQGAVAPFITMAPLVGFGLWYATTRMATRRTLTKRAPDFRIPAAITAAFLALALVATAFAGPPGASGQAEQGIHLGPVPGASALAPGAYEGLTLTVNGSILVSAGERLELRNSTVSLNPHFTPDFGIFVEAGGTLVVNNTSIRPAILGRNYTFEILGSAEISDSIIWGLWGDRANFNFDGGIEVYSSDVVIRGSLLQGGDANTIYVRGAGPLIEGNTIVGARDDCIELHDSTAIVVNNTIRDCGYGIYIHNRGAPIIRGNLIGFNKGGIDVAGGTPMIEDNRFTQNRNYAIYHRTGISEPVILNNVFTSPLDTVESASGLRQTLLLLIGFSVSVSTASLAGMWKVGRSAKRKDEEEAQFDPLALPPSLR